ncbi:hypothetical protein D3C72_2179760 [compost metagenome]
MLASAGYAAPFYNQSGALVSAQPEAVQHIITFAFVGLETLTSIILIVLLAFLNVEKNLDSKQQEISARREENLYA